jgi:hypothetical protein
MFSAISESVRMTAAGRAVNNPPPCALTPWLGFDSAGGRIEDRGFCNRLDVPSGRPTADELATGRADGLSGSLRARPDRDLTGVWVGDDHIGALRRRAAHRALAGGHLEQVGRDVLVLLVEQGQLGWRAGCPWTPAQRAISFPYSIAA